MERCDFLTFTVQSRMDDEAETPPDYPPQGSDGVTKLYSFKYTVLKIQKITGDFFL